MRYPARPWLVGAGMLLIVAFGGMRSVASAETVYWTGAASTDWANSGNWTNATGDAAHPGPGTNVVIDVVYGGATTNHPTLDLSGGAVTIGSLIIGESTASTLTFSNGNVTDKKLAVTGNVVIGSNGALTHTANSTTAAGEVHRLFLDVGGNLTIAEGGAINLDGRGYANAQGPGAGNVDRGGTHGGVGGPNSDTATPTLTTYGSVTAPTNSGSGGGGSNRGGGVGRIIVAEVASIHGSISSAGGSSSYAGGSGGSIFLTTGALEGSGSLRATGGTGTRGGGGGGRVAVALTNEGADFDGFNSITAYGADRASLNRNGAAGTVYLETEAQGPGGGMLVIDNNDVVSLDAVTTRIPAGQTWSATTFATLVMTNAGVVEIPATTTLDAIALNVWGDPTDHNEGIMLRGGALLTPDAYVFSNFWITVRTADSTFDPPSSLAIGTNAILRVDVPLTFTAPMTVAAGGNLSHSPNADTELYKLDLQLPALTVASGGSVDVSSKGYAEGQGPGNSGSSDGASHGGKGGPNAGDGPVSGPTYGSIRSPDRLGSGSNRGGGGAVLLTVTGTTTIAGPIHANGGSGSWSGASGGSIHLKTGYLIGSANITANGASGSRGYGGGGRIAVELTGANARFDDFTGMFAAHGGPPDNPGKYGAAGTIYLRDADSVHGRLIIDNNNYGTAALATTLISDQVTDAEIGTVILRNAAKLSIDADQSLTVHGNWSNTTANAVSGAGRVVLTGADTITLYGSTTFANLVCTNAGKTLRFEAGTTQTITSGFTFTGAEGNPLTLESTTADSSWYLTQAVVHDVQHVAVRDSDAGGGDPVLARDSFDIANNVNWVFSNPGDIVWTGNAGNSSWAATNNWDRGRAPLTDDPSITVAPALFQPVLDIDREFNGNLIIQPGATLTLNGNNLLINGGVANAGTLTATGAETLTFRSDVDFTNGSFQPAESTLVLEALKARTFAPDGNTFHDILVTDTNQLTITDSFTARNLMFAGVSVEADFSGFTIDNLRGLHAGGGTLTFAAGADHTVRILALRGGAATNLLLRSSSPGIAWNLNVNGFNTIRLVDVQDSDASGGITVYAVNTLDSDRNTNWDFGAGKAWAGSTTAWSTPGNWSPEGAPDANTYVLIDEESAVQPVIDLAGGAITVLRLVVGASADAMLTFANGNVSDNRLIVTEDVAIGAFGTLTHTGNASGEIHRLFMESGADLTVESGGKIDVSAKGYAAGHGPGFSNASDGASHGGKGGPHEGDGPVSGPTYGSMRSPDRLGSGGGDGAAGGGVVLLIVSGTTTLNGPIRANGQSTSWSGATGGSIRLITEYLIGSASMTANGASGTRGYGGGGRIAVKLTGANARFDDFTGTFTAYGGPPDNPGKYGAAGTVYLRDDDGIHGRLIIDNHNFGTAALATTLISDQVTDTEIGDVILRQAGKLRIDADQTLTVHGSWSNAATFTADSGSTVEFAGPAPATVWGNTTWQNLAIAARRKTVRFEAGKTQTVNGIPIFDNGVTLRSTADGDWWHLRKPGNGTQEVGRVSVRDSHAGDPGEHFTFQATGGVDMGNNVNWADWPPLPTVIMLR